MARRVISFILTCIVCIEGAFAQTKVLPDDLVLDQRLNYDKYTSYVVPAINWLQSTPLNQDYTQRRRLDNFIMYWLQKNTDIIVTMPDYLVKFQSVNNEFYFLYTGGWIKYVMETRDTNRINCYLAGVKSMLHYYSAGMGIKKSDYIDFLVKLDRDGKLRGLYDSSSTAKNTYLYLTVPSSKSSYAPDENYFNFHFTAINFINPRSVIYRYKLLGYYDEWISTNDESITFPKLPPGNYRFVVQASVLPDFSNAAEDSYSFTIKAPLWKEPWFITIVVITLLILVLLYIRQREKGLKSLALLQQQRMIFEYEHLRSQINPHFLFNSLNTLTGLIEENPDEAMLYTEHLSDLYRNVLAYRSEDLVLLQEELDILNNYVHIQTSRFGNALQLKLEIPEHISKNKKIVPLALQLLVENAMKHNIVSMSQPLIIHISADEDFITVKNNIQPKISKEKGVGLGLANLRKRYALATDRLITFGNDGNEYVVKLPLL